MSHSTVETREQGDGAPVSTEIEARVEELPEDTEVVAYCLLSDEAVETLRKHGISARRLDDAFSSVPVPVHIESRGIDFRRPVQRRVE